MDDTILSVSDFLDVVNEALGVRDFTVQGEVIGAKGHPTGFYFSLKDPDAEGKSAKPSLMDCYMSPYAYRNAGVPLEDGMLIRARGIASIYKPKGRFSFRVESLQLAGEGSLKKAYEALKKKLAEEGLFDRKRALPPFVGRIGVITSRTGAVIDDFRNNLKSLGLSVGHYDVRVEGAQAPAQIRGALAYFNAHATDYDVIVLIRGGGSFEDLQPFNDEEVVRGVFGMRMPTIVSIGHHRDVPLAQLAADVSASTPTGVAHAINETWAPLTSDVPALAARLSHGYATALSGAQADVRSAADRLAVHVARITHAGSDMEQKLIRGLERIGERIDGIRQHIDAAQRQLDASNPERLLRLGYSIVTDETGAVIRRVRDVRHGQSVETRLTDGAFTSEVKELLSK